MHLDDVFACILDVPPDDDHPLQPARVRARAVFHLFMFQWGNESPKGQKGDPLTGYGLYIQLKDFFHQR